MSSDILARVRPLIAALFHVPADSVGPQTSQQNLPAWDSMGHLNLVLELEQEFGVSLPPEAAEKMTDVAAVVRVIEAATGGAR